MKQILILISISFLTLTPAHTQENTNTLKEEKLQEMNKLSFMTGSWEGSGWIQLEDGSRSSFEIYETVQEKLDGLVYLVEGLGNSGDITTHNAIALISWDPEINQYSFQTHTMDGRSANANAVLKGNTFKWGFDIPGGGKIRYDLRIIDNYKWNEKGFFSPDGNNWYPFMEMTLQRITE
ncbi:MAG: DUF1579 domain-containing protein [Bacteroidales bacterium]|nr:DUF1579 domain-containing protein [Bacteroidales bacterium]